MTFEASYDVIVVDAGPAGSTSVLYTAKNGASVLLLNTKERLGFRFSVPDFFQRLRKFRLCSMILGFRIR